LKVEQQALKYFRHDQNISKVNPDLQGNFLGILLEQTRSNPSQLTWDSILPQPSESIMGSGGVDRENQRPSNDVRRNDARQNTQRSESNNQNENHNTSQVRNASPEQTNQLRDNTEICEASLVAVYEENPQAYEAVVYAVAEVLNIPTPEVETYLAKENIAPYELLDPTNQTKLVQAVYQAQTPVDLLAIPEIKEVFYELDATIKYEYANISLEKYQAQDIAPEDQLYPVHELANELLTTQQPTTSNTTQQATQVQTQTTNTVNVGETLLQTATTATSGEFQANYGEAPQDHIALAQNPLVLQNKPQATTDIKLEGQILPTNIDKTATAPKGITPLAAQLQQINAPDIIEQIKAKVKATMNGNMVSELKMILKPENLGEVTLRVLSENGIIQAKFYAENQRIKEIIESNLSELRESLAEQGIDVSELTVTVSQEENNQLENFLLEQQKSQQRIGNIIKNIMAEEEAQDQEAETLLDMQDSSVNYTA
jgi:flagellar hook-length control protein FliK